MAEEIEPRYEALRRLQRPARFIGLRTVGSGSVRATLEAVRRVHEHELHDGDWIDLNVGRGRVISWFWRDGTWR